MERKISHVFVSAPLVEYGVAFVHFIKVPVHVVSYHMYEHMRCDPCSHLLQFCVLILCTQRCTEYSVILFFYRLARAQKGDPIGPPTEHKL